MPNTQPTHRTITDDIRDIREGQTPAAAAKVMTPLARAARTIAGLYNNSRPQGMGILHFNPAKMTPEEALGMAREGAKAWRNECSMDYVRGRVIKERVNCLTGEPASNGRLYDRGLGDGAFALAVADGLADPLYASLDEVAS